MSWFQVLKPIFASQWWEETVTFLLLEEAKKRFVAPSASLGIFCRALFDTAPENVRIVIIGQDPYTKAAFRINHQTKRFENSPIANGRAFAVNSFSELTPSLRNINKEMIEDIGAGLEDGTLDSWACQGVMLLNTHLTTGLEPMSHAHLKWPTLTGAILEHLNNLERPIIFVAWGNEAQAVVDKHVTHPRHFVIKSAHPSPLSAHKGFFGSKPFSKINTILDSIGSKPINWSK